VAPAGSGKEDGRFRRTGLIQRRKQIARPQTANTGGKLEAADHQNLDVRHREALDEVVHALSNASSSGN
jgi:hypothetical protein